MEEGYNSTTFIETNQPQERGYLKYIILGLIVLTILVFAIIFYLYFNKSDSNLTDFDKETIDSKEFIGSKEVIDCGEIIPSDIVISKWMDLNTIVEDSPKLKQKYECLSENFFSCNPSILKSRTNLGSYDILINGKYNKYCKVTIKSIDNSNISCNYDLEFFEYIANEPEIHSIFMYIIASTMNEQMIYNKDSKEYDNPKTNKTEIVQCEINKNKKATPEEIQKLMGSCLIIKEDKERDNCLMELATEQSDKLSHSDIVNFCSFIGNSFDEGTQVNREGGELIRAQCIRKFTSPSSCEIEDKNYKLDCEARRDENYKLCEKMKIIEGEYEGVTEREFIDACIYNVAIISGDFELCNKIEGSLTKEECLRIFNI